MSPLQFYESILTEYETWKAQKVPVCIDNKNAGMGLPESDGKASLTVIGSNTIKNVAIENVKIEAIIITDMPLSYQGLALEYAGHKAVNHSQMEFKTANPIQRRFNCHSPFCVFIYPKTAKHFIINILMFSKN